MNRTNHIVADEEVQRQFAYYRDKTALEWIREYTEADVRYYLLNTDLSVKEIAEELGFPNLSFFGKFCRRAFGYSPNDFRKEMLRLSK